MYAGDASISYSSKNMENINQTLNSELGHLKQWLQGNKLSLNVLKTPELCVPNPTSRNLLKKLLILRSFSLVTLEFKM